MWFESICLQALFTAFAQAAGADFLIPDMTVYLLLNHLLNFMAPAALTALFVSFFPRCFANFFQAKDALLPHWGVQLAVNFAVGVGVLLTGLVLLGRDGKMLTYLMLMLATATSQWGLLGGWDRSGQALKNLYIRIC